MTSVRAFTFLSIVLGLVAICGHFYLYGPPSSAGEIFSSLPVGGLCLLLVGFGILKARPRARTFGKALALVGMIGPVLGAISIVRRFQTVDGSIRYVNQIFEKHPNFMDSVPLSWAFLIAALMLYYLICFSAYQSLKSDSLQEHFVIEDFWFGQTLVHGGFDFKVLAAMLILIYLMGLDFLAPKSFRQNFEKKKFDLALDMLNESLNNSTEKKTPAELAELARIQEIEDRKKTNFMSFSLDEKNLFVATNDQQGRRIDLVNGKQTAQKMRIESLQEFNYVSRDGNSIYLEKNKSVFRVVAYDEISLFHFKNFRFFGFGPDSRLVLMAGREQPEIFLYDILKKTKLWTLRFDARNPATEVLWSASHQWALLNNSGTSLLLHITSGRTIPIKANFNFVEVKSFDPRDSTLLLSGPTEVDRKKYSTLLISLPSGSVQKLATTEKAVAYSPLQKRIWLNPPGRLEAHNLGKNPPQQEFLAGCTVNDKFYISPDQNHVVVVRENSEQAEAYRLSDSTKKFVGKKHPADSRFASRTTQGAWSQTGNLFALSNRKHLEIFWLSELFKNNAKTYNLDLDIRPTQLGTQ